VTSLGGGLLGVSVGNESRSANDLVRLFVEVSGSAGVAVVFEDILCDSALSADLYLCKVNER